MGLGLLGRGVGDAAFLARCGAQLTVTDTKNARELASSLRKLKKYRHITYVLGRHRPGDFKKADMVVKSAGVPFDSPYVRAAEKASVPVTMSTALFMKLLPPDAIVVGITGTRGKSTVAHLLFEILKADKRRVHLGGNVRGVSTLALLPKIKKGDIVVLELDSWQLQGFGAEKISPHIAIFTNFMPDHMNYYRGNNERYWRDKANIFRFQRKGDAVIVGAGVAPAVVSDARRKGNVAAPLPVPRSWKLALPGEHNRSNAAFAVAAARRLGVPERIIKRTVLAFQGVPRRLEFLRTVRGVRIYNDTTATTPFAAATALHALGNKRKKNIVLIAGGSDKGLDPGPFANAIKEYCTAVVTLPGNGTDALLRAMQRAARGFTKTRTLKEATAQAFRIARKGNILLFSPGFTSFGLFKNEFDRGDRFTRLVRRLR